MRREEEFKEIEEDEEIEDIKGILGMGRNLGFGRVVFMRVESVKRDFNECCFYYGFMGMHFFMCYFGIINSKIWVLRGHK